MNIGGGQTVVSFSGGKDSTVLLHIARQVIPNMKAVFFNTGIEFPSLIGYVKSFDNVDIVKPKMSFYQVLRKYGYPVVSKEVGSALYGTRVYIDRHREALEKEYGGKAGYLEMTPIAAKYNARASQLEGTYDPEFTHGVNPGIPTNNQFNKEKWKFLMGAPFKVSDNCCGVMKKSVAHSYETKNKVKFITATMAAESRLRTSVWLKYGCNAFESTHPKSNPMSFWTENDVLAYAYKNKIKLAPPYGEIIKEGDNDNYSQLELFEKEQPIFYTTCYNRTGCYTCGFGIHLEKSPTRLEKLEPKLRDVTLQGGRFEDGLWMPYRGFGFYFVYKYMNVYGGTNIIIPEEKKYFDALPSEAKDMLTK